MKPGERFITALKGGIPDRVPIFEFLFSPKLQDKYIGKKTVLYDGGVIVELANKLGIDGVPVFTGGYCGFEFFETAGDTFTDDWGVTYIKKGWPVMVQIDNPIKSRRDWKRYKMPDYREPWRMKQIKDAIAANKNDIAIVPCFLGPVTMLYWYFMDITTFSYFLIEEPELITEICDAYTEWTIKLAGEVARIKGIDALLLADDWGASDSLLISPMHLKKYFIGPFGKIVKALKDLGFPVIMHNDGKLWDVLDDLVDTGIDGYHPVEKAATMDLGIIKKKYSDRLCPIGNVNNKTVMVSGTPDEVIEEALECLRIGAPGGRYIIATDHSLHDDIPGENVTAYIEAVKKYGNYPIRIPG
ncbi:MAG: hypothetical protein JW770_01085 [Actinobacteria bacterium]|nr:hypothetical protein [Actinomycetota bacterium]